MVEATHKEVHPTKTWFELDPQQQNDVTTNIMWTDKVYINRVRGWMRALGAGADEEEAVRAGDRKRREGDEDDKSRRISIGKQGSIRPRGQLDPGVKSSRTNKQQPF